MEGRLRLRLLSPRHTPMRTSPFCLAGRLFVVLHQKFRLPAAKARYLNLPNSRTTTREEGNDFQGWAIYTDGGTRVSEGETSAGWSAVARSPDGRLYITFGPVITTEAFYAYAGARLHSNDTSELSSIIEAFSFLGPNGPVARDSHAFFFYNSRHATSICLGTVQSRANVASELTCQRLLLQVQLRLRLTMQHIYSHAQNPRNECADHAAALGAFGLVSNQNIRARWMHSSFDSTSLFAPGDNLDDASLFRTVSLCGLSVSVSVLPLDCWFVMFGSVNADAPPAESLV